MGYCWTEGKTRRRGEKEEVGWLDFGYKSATTKFS